MKYKTSACAVAATVLVGSMISVQLPAEDGENQEGRHHHYRLIDLGTSGGPMGYFSSGPAQLRVLNQRGTPVGSSDTTTLDPYSPDCVGLDCYVTHAFKWEHDVRTDLGSLPGTTDSDPLWISDSGLIVGLSENGSVDPLTGFPELRAILWEGDRLVDLGTFGGNASVADAVNDWGQVVGGALNASPDRYAWAFPYTAFPAGQQWRAFLWQQGTMQDLGTLGGDDAVAALVNNLGQVAGASFTNTIPNATTGYPTMDPFMWQNGKMHDLGSLGGTVGYPNALNLWGQVVGQSNLAGDVTFHPFLWTDGVLRDLGTLGGNDGIANWINDAGDVVGRADVSGSQTHHAFLWKNGAMQDLGTVDGDPCSTAYVENIHGQVVGSSGVCFVGGHGFLWERGSIVDLQSLVLPGSDLSVIEAVFINDHGEIAGTGIRPNGDVHPILLQPVD